MTDIRDKSTSLLSSTLSSLSSQGGNSASQATAIEAAIYEKHQGDTGNEYREEVRQLSLNLKHNDGLGTQVADGSISAATLTQMTSEQMKSSKRAAEDSELRKQALQDARGAEGKMPVHGGEGQRTANDDMTEQGQDGTTDASMGEEGDFKLRGQPKIQGLEGIEFETGF